MLAVWNGFVVIDKPAGITSRRVVDRVQQLVRPAKAGHAGTLDPMATGILIVCVGPATRLISFLQENRKVYDATFLLGMRSDTDDVTGNVIEIDGVQRPDTQKIQATLRPFVGRISQVPPKYSAVHVEGRRAYDLARRGEEVDLKPRDVDVYSIDLSGFEWPELQLRIECGSGTYIRSIGRDLGEALGCGAVMSHLQRVASGRHCITQAIGFGALDAETLRRSLQCPMQAVAQLPVRRCTEHESTALRQGRSIPVGDDSQTVPDSSSMACVADGDELVAVAEFQRERGLLLPRVVLPRS